MVDVGADEWGDHHSRVARLGGGEGGVVGSCRQDSGDDGTERPTPGDQLMGRLQTARTRVRSLIAEQPVGWRPLFESLLWPVLGWLLARPGVRRFAAWRAKGKR